MEVTTALSDALGSYLDLTSEQMKLTASNMANVDTPGYRTKGFDFEQAFLAELNDASGTSGSLGAQAPVGNVDGLVSRPDGNNVSMDREGMQLAKEQLQFRFGVSLLRDQYSNVMSAIHAEAK
ncbi:flagellar basal body rod protein FlgB [Edaphobacter sp.]|uniref:flagellar basal body rod protein FlgB n=1 Tax=Edaphobacter sp. TaxID=1934404 RepID=UPI002DBE7456|nr:flagellar basal body rod protein FlgB [Edaphobacter sp.]HEU5342651.1 flagellar basal body rod protein FlgB [Edaphobacter sp.]